MGVNARFFVFVWGLAFFSIPPEGCGFWNAVPNNFSVACVLVSLFVSVLNNVCGWKKGNDIRFFKNSCSAFIITCPNYVISVSVDHCFIRTYIYRRQAGLQNDDENGPQLLHLPTQEHLNLPSES